MKILVVDDEKLLVKGIKFNLENEGYAVDACYDGATAVQMAAQGGYDLIVLDLMMPGLDGLGACQRIRQTSTVPIIMLTAKSEDADKLLGFESGADDYITKPFNTQLLLMRCNNLILNRRNLQQKYLRSETSSTEPLSTNPIDSHLLAQATELIERNIDVPGFDIMTFARELGLSRTNLFNKIKGLTGQTPNNFVISLRLKRAAEMIRLSPESSITQIAYESGFNTTGHFIKCFKRIYGETPLSYRKRCLKG